ncbi:MAG: hypothetical protein ABJ251_10450 [Paracoccaceae bacterium]
MTDGERVLIFSSEKTTMNDDYSLMGGETVGAVEVEELIGNFAKIQPTVNSLIERAKDASSDGSLQEVTVSLGINAKGAVGFLGTGAEIGGSATLTLKYKI